MAIMGTNRKATATVVLAILLMAVFPLTQAQPLPEVTITVEDPGKVSTDDVEYTHVTVKGEVTVENFPLGAEVQINASTDTTPNWVLSVSPDSFTVDQGLDPVSAIINIDLRVPPRASTERETTLTVFANATGPGGFERFDEKGVPIEVRQFYGVRVDTNRTTSVDQGSNTTYRFRVTNSGNGPDNFTVSLTNGAALRAGGLNLTYNQNIYELGQDRAYAVLVEISASSEAKVTEAGQAGVDALFSVVSQGDSAKSAKFTLTIIVREGTPTNGGNGGNGDDGNDNPGFGSALVLMSLSIVVAIAIYRRRRRI
jgi:hypothetical protein